MGLSKVTVNVPSTEYVAGDGINITNGVISNTYSNMEFTELSEGVRFNNGTDYVNVPSMTDHEHIYTGYDKNSNVINHKTLSGGAVIDSQYCYVTKDFIEILSDTSYTLKGDRSETSNRIAFYDADKTFISEHRSSMSSSSVTVTSPSNAKYMLGCFMHKSTSEVFGGTIKETINGVSTIIFDADPGMYVEGLEDKPTGTKATVISSTSTDSEIPTAKAVYDLFNSIADVTSVTW